MEKKRTFGVKVVVRKVQQQKNLERAKYWDEFLGITGHTGDTSGGGKSEYYKNLQKIRRAQEDGLDPYDFHAFLKDCGYVSLWTPKLPESSLNTSQFSYSQGGTGGRKTGQKTGPKSGNRTGGRSGRKTGRSRGRK